MTLDPKPESGMETGIIQREAEVPKKSSTFRFRTSFSRMQKAAVVSWVTARRLRVNEFVYRYKDDYKQMAQTPVISQGFRGADARFLAFFLLASLDLGALWAGCLIAFDLDSQRANLSAAFGLLASTYILFGAMAGAYSRRALLSPSFSVGAGLKAVVLAIGAVLMLASLRGYWNISQSSNIALAAGTASVLIFAGRVSAAVLSNLTAQRFSTDLILIDDAEPAEIPVNYVPVRSSKLGVGSQKTVGAVGFSRLTKLAVKADRVLVSCSAERGRFWADIFDTLAIDAAMIVPGVRAMSVFDREFDTALPIIRISRGPFGVRERILKRGFDIGVSVPLFVVLTPVLGMLWIALALTNRSRKVTHTQILIGMRNVPFRTSLFRTDGSDWTSRFLKKTGFDRLPLLLDVVLGRMSVVGPAPVLLDTDTGHKQHRRNLKPGLIEPRSQKSGTSYRENWTIWRDIASLLRFKPTRIG